MTKEFDQAEAIEKAVKDRVVVEAAAYPDVSLNNGEIDPVFIEQCLGASELGDGVLFAELQRHKYIFDVTAKEWLAWTGQYWEYDDHNKAQAAVEDVVALLLQEANKMTAWIETARQKKEK